MVLPKILVVGDFMFFLGIDIAKNSHVASLIDSDGNILFKAFSFKNSVVGASALIDKINKFDKKTFHIGMEATGHYWLSLYSFLIENQYTVHVINPIQTDGWRKATEIRKRKTDIIDSLLIADFIRFGDFKPSTLANEDYLSLRNLSRFRNYMVSSISDLKRKTICVLDQIFPEYQSVFSNIFGQTSKEILINLSSPADFESISTSMLEKILNEISHKKFASRKISEISFLAKNSFGISFCIDSMTLQLKLLIQQINFIENQVKDIEEQIIFIVDKINSPIISIPGISYITGAVILGEIGDINRFSNPSKIVAFAGIDASVSQSGNFQSTSSKMSKRGSPYLRKALFQAALVASNCDPVFSAYYSKKRSEGKHHLTAVGAVARKLCYTIYAILKSNQPYRKQ